MKYDSGMVRVQNLEVASLDLNSGHTNCVTLDKLHKLYASGFIFISFYL